MSKTVSVYFSCLFPVNLPLNCLDSSCKKARYASLWNQLCSSEQCSMSGLMYKVTIRLWAACSELFFCQRLLNHLLSWEAKRIFIRGTPKKQLSRVVFPTAEVSGMAGIATFTWACQKRKGTNDLSVAYGDTNKQDGFSRKLFQELPSAVQHRCNFIQIHADLQQVGAHLYPLFLWVTSYTWTHPAMEFLMHRNRLFL